MSGESLPRVLRGLDKGRLAAYARNLSFYGGEQWPGERGRARRRVTFNYARAVVDKVTSYVMSDVRVNVRPAAVGEPGAAAARSAELALAAVGVENGLPRLDYETETDAAVLGDGAFKATWSPESERVVVSAPDVQGLFVWRDPVDRRTPERVAERYSVTPLAGGRPVQVVEDWTAEKLTVWQDDVVVSGPVANAYGFVPYVVFPNLPVPKSPWGWSDVAGVRDVAEEINRCFTALSRILELSGNPIAVLSGVVDSQDIAVEPGALWEMPEGTKAYLLDLLSGGGVKVHLDYLDAVYRSLHDVGEVPRTAFGDNARSLSGVALEIELQPLQQKVRRKRVIRADVYRRRAEMVLALLDLYTGTSHAAAGAVEVTWGPLTPSDPNADVAREAQRVGAALSTAQSAMGRLGVEDPEAEFEGVLVERSRLVPPAAAVGGA